jgi:hypothetical protein
MRQPYLCRPNFKGSLSRKVSGWYQSIPILVGRVGDSKSYLKYREFSSAGSEHLPYKQRVGGSIPSTPTQTEVKGFRYLKPFLFVNTSASTPTIKRSLRNLLRRLLIKITKRNLLFSAQLYRYLVQRINCFLRLHRYIGP